MTLNYRNIVVWDSSRNEAELCDVKVRSGKFASIEPASGTNALGDFDGRGTVAMLPGFVNAHGHAAMSLLRGLGEELPLMEWLQKRIWPVENRLCGDFVKAGTDLAIMEMLSTGTTCFADMYFFMDRVAESALAAGMRCGLSRGITYDETADDKLEENLKLARDFSGRRGLISVQLGPHAPYTVPFEFMKVIADAARENDLGIQLHWLETEGEWKMCGVSDDYTPEEYLEAAGLIENKNLLLAHCVWVEKDKVPFYSRPNVTIAHNPKSNLKLGSGLAHVPEMLEGKVRVALGTDGAASNNRLDMWDEMRFAALLHKGINNDPTLMAAKDVFAMATVHGAKGLGFDDCGLIKEGYAADFMLVDLDRPHYVGWDLNNLPWCIVYAGSSADILSTSVAGETLYEEGEFKSVDRDAAMSEVAKARAALTEA